MPVRAMAAGIEVMATFWTRPFRTCGATGSALSARMESVARFAPGPKAIGFSPKPFGMMSATGASPLRTACSAWAAV